MKESISRITRFGNALIVTVILQASIAFAQNPAAQPERSANADPNAGERQGRGIRGPGENNQQGGNVQRGGRGNFGGWGLDEKQTELLREAMQADIDEIRKLDEKLRAAQKELVQAVIAEKYDEKTVREKAEAVARIQTEITMLRAKQVAAVAPTLKPEQREQWENSQIAISLLMRGGGAPGNASLANRFGGGGPGSDAGFGRGDRRGLQGGVPQGQQPGGRNLRGNNGDPNATEQTRRRRGDGQ